MSVEGVNNQNNNALSYSAGAASIGAVGGVGAAYLTRPYLTDGAPTDTFIKTINEKCKEALPPELREAANAVEKQAEAYQNVINNAKSVDEIKEAFVKTTTGNLTDELFAAQKDMAANISEGMQQMGLEVSKENIEKLKNINNIDEMKAFMGQIFDKEFAGKSVDEVKQIINSESKAAGKKMYQRIFEQFYDAGKKEFVNCEEGVGKIVKDAARSIQGKYAAVYGGIAAAVLGLGTYLGVKACHKTPENIDTQA